MLSSAGFCGGVLLLSPWLRDVKHPSFFVTGCLCHMTLVM